MTFSSVCWALGPSTPPWETTTPITSSYRLVGGYYHLLTRNRAQDAPHTLGGELAEQFSWSALVVQSMIHQLNLKALYRNYDHVAKLWEEEQWIPQSAVAQARAHYAAYSVQRTDGLRIITLNTDLCKRLLARLYRSDIMYTTQGIRMYFLIPKCCGVLRNQQRQFV